MTEVGIVIISLGQHFMTHERYDQNFASLCMHSKHVFDIFVQREAFDILLVLARHRHDCLYCEEQDSVVFLQVKDSDVPSSGSFLTSQGIEIVHSNLPG